MLRMRSVDAHRARAVLFAAIKKDIASLSLAPFPFTESHADEPNDVLWLLSASKGLIAQRQKKKNDREKKTPPTLQSFSFCAESRDAGGQGARNQAALALGASRRVRRLLCSCG